VYVSILKYTELTLTDRKIQALLYQYIILEVINSFHWILQKSQCFQDKWLLLEFLRSMRYWIAFVMPNSCKSLCMQNHRHRIIEAIESVVE